MFSFCVECGNHHKVYTTGCPHHNMGSTPDKFDYNSITPPNSPFPLPPERDEPEPEWDWTIGQYGWICPRCGRGNSPSTSTCPCIPIPLVVTYNP